MRPGDSVKAMEFSSSSRQPASLRAASTTGTMFCIWARLASSGTTPPYRSWTACPAMILERMRPSRLIAQLVSSQEDSMARRVTGPVVVDRMDAKLGQNGDYAGDGPKGRGTMPVILTGSRLQG